MTTFQDAIDLLVDYLGGSPTDTVQRDCRRAVLEAYRDLTNAFKWSYLLTHGRLVTTGPLFDGTIAYTQATRRVVLTPLVGSPMQTWPDWSVGSYVRVGFVAGKVVQRIDDVTLLLDEQVNFGQDLPALTVYRLYRDTYLLPPDFVAGDQALYEQNFGGMDFVHPREWLIRERFIYNEGVPIIYTITGDAVFPGRLVLRLAPIPAEQKTIDYIYHRAPRPLSLSLANAGTASMTSGGTTVTGSGTAFTPLMVGSCLRLSAGSAAPTSVVGKNPAILETVVTAWTSATSIEVADPAPQGFAGVAYTVSDRLDIEERSMLNAFNRCCEMHLSMNRTLKDKPSAAAQYRVALSEARSADSRSFMGRYVGDGEGFPRRLRDRGPVVFNQS